MGIRYFFALSALWLGFSTASALQITPPPGWSHRGSNIPGVQQHFADSSETGAEITRNLLVTGSKVPAGESLNLDSLMIVMTQVQRRILPMYAVHEDRERTVGGQAGRFVVSTHARGEEDYANVQFIYIRNDDFVMITYTCILEELVSLRSVFEASLQSLKPDAPDFKREETAK